MDYREKLHLAIHIYWGFDPDAKPDLVRLMTGTSKLENH